MNTTLKKTINSAIAVLLTLVADYFANTPETLVSWKGGILAVLAGLSTWYVQYLSGKNKQRKAK